MAQANEIGQQNSLEFESPVSEQRDLAHQLRFRKQSKVQIIEYGEDEKLL